MRTTSKRVVFDGTVLVNEDSLAVHVFAAQTRYSITLKYYGSRCSTSLSSSNISIRSISVLFDNTEILRIEMFDDDNDVALLIDEML